MTSLVMLGFAHLFPASFDCAPHGAVRYVGSGTEVWAVWTNGVCGSDAAR